MALLVIGRKNKEEPALKAGSWTLLGANNQEDGGAEEDRTPDLRIANATLSQLSYRPSGRHCKGLRGKREVTIAEGRLFVLARRQVLTPAPLDAGARGFGGLVRMPLQPLSCGPWRRYGPSQANSDLL